MIRRHLLTALLALVASRLLGHAIKLFDWIAEVQYARAWDQAFAEPRQLRPIRLRQLLGAVAPTVDTADTIGAPDMGWMS